MGIVCRFSVFIYVALLFCYYKTSNVSTRGRSGVRKGLSHVVETIAHGHVYFAGGRIRNSSFKIYYGISIDKTHNGLVRADSMRRSEIGKTFHP